MNRFLLLLTALTVAVLPASGQIRKAKQQPFKHEIVEIPRVEPRVIAIETDATSLIYVVRENGALQQLYYGNRLGNASEFSAVPETRGRYSDGAPAYPVTGGRYLGEPALHLRYPDGSHNTELYYTGHTVEQRQGVTVTTIKLKDYVTQVALQLVLEAYPKENVIVQHAEITNGGKAYVSMLNFASGALTLQSGQYLLSHVNGVWAQEMQLETELLTHDLKVIESRRGTQTTQCNNPSFLVSLGTGELREDEGEVVGGALAWSGNFRLSFEVGPEKRLSILGGISPFASAYPLAPGQTFRTPDMIWCFTIARPSPDTPFPLRCLEV